MGAELANIPGSGRHQHRVANLGPSSARYGNSVPDGGDAQGVDSPLLHSPSNWLTPPDPDAIHSAVGHYADEPLADLGIALPGCMRNEPLGSCFLSPAQRSLLLSTFQARVNAALDSYRDAISQVRVDELLKKEPEQSDVMLEILLDVIGMLTSKAAMKALASLAKAGEHAVGGVSVHGAQIAGAEDVKEGLLSATNISKKNMLKAAEKSQTAEVESEKKTSVAFLDVLSNEAATRYEAMREWLIGGADDAQLVVLTESFSAANHTTNAYKTEILGKLERFKKSGVSKIGISHDNKGTAYNPRFESEEMHAFWVQTPVGRRLGLYKSPYEAAPQTFAT